MTYLTPLEIAAHQRRHYWQAVREVCADLRHNSCGGYWREARRCTLRLFLSNWRFAFDAMRSS